MEKVWDLGGELFYYADEKPIGTPKQTDVDPAQRETAAMQEALNRIARHAELHDANVMVMIDQINEKSRAERLPRMYSHILGRAADYREMRESLNLQCTSIVSSAPISSLPIGWQRVSRGPLTINWWPTLPTDG